MKSDMTTTILNLVLAVLVMLGVVFALLAMNRTHDLRQISANATVANNNIIFTYTYSIGVYVESINYLRIVSGIANLVFAS